MPDLLIELFSEEIPARMQRRAAADLKQRMTDGLVEAGLTYAGAVAHCTPRRLALSVQGLTAESPTTSETRRGPRVDAPEKAIEGFLRSTGLAREDLTEEESKKGTFLVAKITTPGRPAAQIVAEVLEATIRDFPWPKSMRWGAGSLRWVRPLRRILCILTDEEGAQVVRLDIDGIQASDVTEGHRFMAPEPFRVTSFDDYEAKLKRAFVVLSSEERAEHIRQDMGNQAFAAGLEIVQDEGLLAEVAGLVEWPVVLMGRIGEDFLDLPPEVLRSSMKEHQKFFSGRAKDGRITHFVTVANRETPDHGATILDGNSRVLSARLADAKFFWENDLRIATAGGDWAAPWLDALSNVTFHAKLGSQRERIERIAALAREIAPLVGADPDMAERAARLAKADLSSEMVYEFPELQGYMGRKYAEAAGEPPEVSAAAEEHWAPKGPSDEVPTAPVSVAVALAEKLDTLAGFWAIDEKPTGSKDPYALRRAALGVIRLVEKNALALRLIPIIGQGNASADATDLLSFFHDRLKVHLRDEGIRHDVIDACLTGDRTDDLADLTARAGALNAFLGTDHGENLIQGYRRAKNILDQAEEKDGVEYSFGADPKLAETDEERALFEALAAARPGIDAAMQAENYPAAMEALAALRAPIDAFFEAVQVNADSDILRRNRLNLLSEIVQICAKIADLSRIGS
ncbi:glycine--tRNA ligase subunit beta [Jannaschia seohaensis]|uniref:Glycine--tRNA ligase beta subunit n=1 Tax=Jannaschia seohaensis TaxID=475081 RepID=A0A2Y9AU27_9RHOB|nr:glycine--tRNA ligase subunit beta [Jannaschia seohaensis]PWJ18313.1 glycyl-tRNA synthetase beta chain [Jannaschia seohaensis]SSA46838.1 glycyl-tRNA synthetase beta chain [Jannaschia seohaensis]